MKDTCYINEILLNYHLDEASCWTTMALCSKVKPGSVVLLTTVNRWDIEIVSAVNSSSIKSFQPDSYTG